MDQCRNLNISKLCGSCMVTSLQISRTVKSNFNYSSLAHTEKHFHKKLHWWLFIWFPRWDIRSRRRCFVQLSTKEFYPEDYLQGHRETRHSRASLTSRLSRKTHRWDHHGYTTPEISQWKWKDQLNSVVVLLRKRTKKIDHKQWLPNLYLFILGGKTFSNRWDPWQWY